MSVQEDRDRDITSKRMGGTARADMKDSDVLCTTKQKKQSSKSIIAYAPICVCVCVCVCV